MEVIPVIVGAIALCAYLGILLSHARRPMRQELPRQTPDGRRWASCGPVRWQTSNADD
jgi:hypothetical protein